VSARVVLYSRAACHLCDEAKAVVADVCAEAEESWEEVDIDTDETLRAKYSDMVPVVTVDGVQHGFWRVDAERLRAALA